MEANHKKILKAIVLELRHMFEGYYNGSGWHAGDLEQRLNSLGVWRDRNPLSADELSGINDADREARRVVDAYLKLRDEAGVSREEAVAEFVRETAYTWANRLLALRCMESRELIDEVILQKEVYGGRSLEHNRLAQRNPELCAGDDDGLFAMLDRAFSKQSVHLPLLFDPNSPGVALKPGIGAIKHVIALLSGAESVRGHEPATSDVFRASDTFGWAYQFWNTEEKDRVFEKIRTHKGTKFEGADVVPATQMYTDPYMVKFLVQNSLGATWVSIKPDSRLVADWEYYIPDADRRHPVRKPVRDITFLDPACGSGHFLLEAFDLLFGMYIEEGELTDPEAICRSILEHNLHGIDIDERAIQISEAVLWMKSSEVILGASGRASFSGVPSNLIATNFRLPRNVDQLSKFLDKHPEDKDLSPALEMVFRGLQHADELGSLVDIQTPVNSKLRQLKEQRDRSASSGGIQTHLYKSTPIQGELPLGTETFEEWKEQILARLEEHFILEREIAKLAESFFSRAAGRSVRLFKLLGKTYDVVAANPPWMGSKNMSPSMYSYLSAHYSDGKRDIYAAFILLCRRLCHGRVAMVTQQSWLFLRTFSNLRTGESGLIRSNHLEVLAHLGRYAFSDLGNAVIQPVLFVFRCHQLDGNEYIYAIRLKAPRESQEQAGLLRVAAKEPTSGLVYRVLQSRFLEIPDGAVVYWLPESYLRLPVSSVRKDTELFISKGIDSCNQSRFLRFWWEVPTLNRFVPYSKAGGYRKWYGLNHYVIDWEFQGSRVKSSILGRHPADKLSLLVQHEYLYGQPSLTYSVVAQGSMNARINGTDLFSGSGPGVFWRGSGSLDSVLAILNTRVISFLLRGLTAGGLSFFRAYVEKLPITTEIVKKWEREKQIDTEWIISAKRTTVNEDFTERTYTDKPFPSSLRGLYVDRLLDDCARTSLLLHAEGMLERKAFEQFGIPPNDEQVTIDETGTPSGWFPLLTGLDGIPDEMPCPEAISVSIAKHDRVSIVPSEMGQLLDRVRDLYESVDDPTGTTGDIDEDDLEDTEEGEEEERVGARVIIPAESFVEDLANRLKIHPLSVYNLIRGGAKSGWRSTLEQRTAEEAMSVVMLHVVGHRWPGTSRDEQRAPDSAVVSFHDLSEQPGILGLLREEIARQFKNSDPAEVEREFVELIGMPLHAWIASKFFSRHITSFKRRPVVWQVGSFMRQARRTPALQAFLSYTLLNSSTLPSIQSQLLRPLKQRLETELRGIENIAPNARSDRQQERSTNLSETIKDLRAFDDELEQIIRSAFGPEKLYPVLRQFAIDDAALCLKAKWLHKLSAAIGGGPLVEWRRTAETTKLHQNLANWIGNSMLRLEHHCSAVGPVAPQAETLQVDPNSESLAFLICKDPGEMVQSALKLACLDWWRLLDEAVFAPLRAQIKLEKDELKVLKAEDYSQAEDPFKRKKEIEARTKELKENVRRWERDLNEKTAVANELRDEMMAWECSEARGWEAWLAAQPMYDAISSLDGVRQAPGSVGEWVAQESAYAPDISDGVRVNIAPLQKAGILAAEVLAAKDVVKAIADRAEWRADERRWCREGKLPQPGWWPMEKTNGSGQK